MTESIKKYILYVVKRNPFITLKEIKYKIEKKYSINLSMETINKYIKNNNISYKRTKTKCFYKKENNIKNDKTV